MKTQGLVVFSRRIKQNARRLERGGKTDINHLPWTESLVAKQASVRVSLNLSPFSWSQTNEDLQSFDPHIPS